MNSGRFRILALMFADSVCLLSIWVLFVWGYKAVGLGDYHTHFYWRLWPVLPLFVGLNAFCRLYHGNWMYPAMPLSPVEEFRRLIATSLFSHLLLMSFLGFTRHNMDYSRLVIAASGVVVGAVSQIFRDIVRHILFRLHIGQIPVVLAGSGETARRVSALLKESAHIGFDVVLAIDEKSLRSIVPEARRRDVKILLACQDERLLRAQLKDFSEWFHYVEFLPRMETFPIFGSYTVSIGEIGGLEMVNQRGMKALKAEKRLVDTILSVLVMLSAFPFFAVLPVLIKLTSKGPVFYRARRLGKKGRTIWVWKFRSMYADADRRLSELLEADPKMKAEFEKDFKLKNDPRVTPLGKIMRKLSLDELPQLFNVFAGDMALVGPRPIVEAEVKYYGKDYEVISHVKPGITGLWQASGRSDTGYDRRVSLDLYYVLNWSPWLDIWIVVRTAWKVLSMRGAY